MKLERTMTTGLGESSICERLSSHFTSAGYQQVIAQPHYMSFQRGKFLTLSAKGCKVNAAIRLVRGTDQILQVTVTLDIDTTGQFIIESEREFWRNEMNDIARAVLGDT